MSYNKFTKIIALTPHCKQCQLSNAYSFFNRNSKSKVSNNKQAQRRIGYMEVQSVVLHLPLMFNLELHSLQCSRRWHREEVWIFGQYQTYLKQNIIVTKTLTQFGSTQDNYIMLTFQQLSPSHPLAIYQRTMKLARELSNLTTQPTFLSQKHPFVAHTTILHVILRTTHRRCFFLLLLITRCVFNYPFCFILVVMNLIHCLL